MRHLLVTGTLALLLFPALVRADAPPTQYDPYLSTDELIVDRNTGYSWERAVSTNAVPLSQVKCPPNGTRVPTVKELATLLDNEPRKVLVGLEAKDLHIDQNAFPRTPPALFWTSSVTPAGEVFVVDFSTGVVMPVPKNSSAYVRCLQRN